MLALAISMLAASPGAAEPCGVVPDEVRSTGVSGLRIGMTAAQIRARCAVRADRQEQDAEGNRVETIEIGRAPNRLTARLDDGRVFNISTTSRAFRTVSGLGVGTPLAVLLRQYPDLLGGQSEGGPLYAYSDSRLCGVSFQLGYRASDRDYRRLGDDWRRADLARLPKTTKVVGVLITGCDAP